VSRTLLETIFWLGPALTVYVYVAFPLLMAFFARQRRIQSDRDDRDVPATQVTVIVPAYNEERNIGARIRNLLASDYPPSLLDVIVVSDASTDGTTEIVRGFEADGVRLIAQERRSGKTAGLNRAVHIARGEIVVFTDANTSYPPATLRTLVNSFHEPTVGLVSGYTKYTVGETGEVAEATNAYSSLERTIKKAESRWGCCVGADGAIFAMRRSLYRTLRNDDINDLVLPLSVIDQGFRCVLADEAYCSENAGASLESEFRRQSRITNRSLRAIWRHVHLLNALQFPGFSFFLFSHKVARFLVPVFLLASAASLVLLARRDRFYLGCAVAAALAALLVAAVRAWPELMSDGLRWNRPIRLLNVFVLMNLAMLHGWWKFLSGNAEVTWQHDRALSR
jgi:cellulose synthase/poly-beta-1,6-N-acetylglucosamine synthase-like glycosyltransferase